MKRKIISVFILIVTLFLIGFNSASQSNSSNYQTDVIFSGGGTNASSLSYSTDSALGIISGNLNSSSFRQSLGFFFCTPTTCSALGYNCGSVDDGCGGNLNCGTCSSGNTCSGGTCTQGGGVVGSSGGSTTSQEIFTVDKTLIKTLIKQGETSREIIEIKNNLDSTINFQIKSSLNQFMVISEESFSLAPKSSKSLFIDIFAKQNEIPNAYTGRMTVTGNGITQIINLIIDVKERNPFFDVAVDILTKEVSAGGDAKAKFSISNLGDLNNMDISLYYAIKDFDGKVISFKEENIAINKELNLTRKLNIPKDTPVGDYVFYLKTSYNNITASSAENFKVTKQVTPSLFLILLIFCTVLVIVTFIFIIILLRKFRFHLEQRNEKEIKVKKIKIKNKIKTELRRYKRKAEERKIEQRKAQIYEQEIELQNQNQQRIELEEKKEERKIQNRAKTRRFFKSLKIIVQKINPLPKIKEGIAKNRTKRQEKKILRAIALQNKRIEQRRIELEEKKKQKRMQIQEQKNQKKIEIQEKKKRRKELRDRNKRIKLESVFNSREKRKAKESEEKYKNEKLKELKKKYSSK